MNQKGTKTKSSSEEEDVVNYKVGRLVMSILREFKVSNILERFEKVLIQNTDKVRKPDLPSESFVSEPSAAESASKFTFNLSTENNSSNDGDENDQSNIIEMLVNLSPVAELNNEIVKILLAREH